MALRIIVTVALLAFGLLSGLVADGRLSPLVVVSTGTAAPPAVAPAPFAEYGGPIVAPVRRVMPVTPPFPEAILAAGDVDEPSRAPAEAPLPQRKDLALAETFKTAGVVQESPVSLTRTAQDLSTSEAVVAE